jgi:putative transposase orfA for insertion sequence element
MALEALAGPVWVKGAILRIADEDELGAIGEVVRTWVKNAWIDAGLRVGTTTQDATRSKELAREARELRRANAILKSASAFSRRSVTPMPPATAPLRLAVCVMRSCAKRSHGSMARTTRCWDHARCM